MEERKREAREVYSMKKRIGGIFLATVLVLSLLTACGGSAGGSSGSKNSAAADMA